MARNRKCPNRYACYGYDNSTCETCEIGITINKLSKKIDRLKKKVEKAEKIKSGEVGAKKLIPLKDYPKGLFIKDNTLCVKTEYGNEAYIIWSGERFWGGAETVKGIGDVMILPITDELVQMIEKTYGDIYETLKKARTQPTNEK